MIKGFEEYTYELTNYETDLVEKLIKKVNKSYKDNKSIAWIM